MGRIFEKWGDQVFLDCPFFMVVFDKLRVLQCCALIPRIDGLESLFTRSFGLDNFLITFFFLFLLLHFLGGLLGLCKVNEFLHVSEFIIPQELNISFKGIWGLFALLFASGTFGIAFFLHNK